MHAPTNRDLEKGGPTVNTVGGRTDNEKDGLKPIKRVDDRHARCMVVYDPVSCEDSHVTSKESD